MTNDEKLTLAREALEEIKRDPDHFTVIHVATEALAAIATESAPAAGAASIDTEKLAEEFGLWSEQREKFVAHVAQQREAGRQEGLQHAVQTISNSIDTAQEALKQRDQLRELLNLKENRITDLVAQLSALAQRAAGDDELPPLTMAVYGTREMLEQERQRRAQFAARAVGGVDVSSLKRYSPTYDESRGADGEDRWGVMEDAEEGEYVKLTDVRALLATAPVGDGDEELEAIYDSTFDQAFQRYGTMPEVTSAKAEQVRLIRAALTQQKG